MRKTLPLSNQGPQQATGPLNPPRTRAVRRRPAVLTRVLLSLGLLAWAGAARASHYAVADVPRLITPAQVAKLHKGKVETTEELLNKGATSKDRKALAKATGLTGPELLVLVHRSDLLRIKGVGSEMVLLFEAAGVKSTADLVAKDPTALTAETDRANKTAKISEKPPTEPQIADWIGQAKKLPQVVESK
jgi:predicted flap endonuclease-1-like 5' DNA nuclease